MYGMASYRVYLNIHWVYAGDGIVRQIMGYDEHLMMVKVKFNQGAVRTLIPANYKNKSSNVTS